MGAPFMTMWDEAQVDLEAEKLTPGETLGHIGGEQFAQAGVAVGDRVYVLARERGLHRLLLIARIDVERITDQKGAKAFSRGTVYKATEHLLGRGSEMRLDRVVPEDAARAVRRYTGKELKIADTEYRLDQQTLRRTGRLTEESAALLDDLLMRTSRIPVDLRSYREGKRTERAHIAVERSGGLRAAALAIHGTACQACGFSFEATYGSLGAGFAEVHHLVAFKDLKSVRFVDPKTDVSVLCANCHRMVHRGREPLPLSALRSALAAARGC